MTNAVVTILDHTTSKNDHAPDGVTTCIDYQMMKDPVLTNDEMVGADTPLSFESKPSDKQIVPLVSYVKPRSPSQKNPPSFCPANKESRTEEHLSSKIDETATQLLWQLIIWVGTVPNFRLLPSPVQIQILRNCWTTLWMLDMVLMGDQPTLMEMVEQFHESGGHLQLVKLGVKAVLELQLDAESHLTAKLLTLFSPDNFWNFGSEWAEHGTQIRNELIEELIQRLDQTGSGSVPLTQRVAEILLVLTDLR